MWLHDNLFPKGMSGVRLMINNYVSLSLTNEASSIFPLDFISIGTVSDFISKQLANSEWSTPKNEGCRFFECRFSIDSIDFRMLIDLDADNVRVLFIRDVMLEIGDH